MTGDIEGPGAVLRAARESRDIAVREVAEVLNLPVGVVEAIEANNHDLLPSAVFAKGYIRAYAKLLELDSDPLIATFPDASNVTAEVEVVVRDWMGEFFRENPRQVVGGAIGLVSILLLSLVTWFWPDADARPEIELELPEEPSGEPMTTLDLGPITPRVVQSAIGTIEPELSLSYAEAGQEQDVVADGQATVTLTVDGRRRISPEGEDRLQFRFTDECWVEVKSGDGGKLYSDLGREGSSLELVGRAPFRILLGYAPGASMVFNDEPVALAPHTRNNVATLVLGQ